MLEFVVDFYCEQLKLVIEVDGSVHLDPTVQIEDEYKDNSIQAYGMDLIRFTNGAMVIQGLRLKMFRPEDMR